MSDFLFSSSPATTCPPEESPWDDTEGDLAEERERTRRRLQKRHRTMLGIAVSVVALSFLLQVEGETQVAFRGLGDYPLPELCGSQALFGTECPGCGLTRSILSLARGDWERSLEFHRVGWVMAVAIVLQIPYRSYRLRELNSKISKSRWPVWFGNFLIALLVTNWLTNALFGQ